jgi:hypothetical protein
MCIKLVIKKLIDIMMHGQRNIKILSDVYAACVSIASTLCLKKKKEENESSQNQDVYKRRPQ